MAKLKHNVGGTTFYSNKRAQKPKRKKRVKKPGHRIFRRKTTATNIIKKRF